MNRIVIIGGMGPQASIELQRRIVERATMLGAEENHEFPNIVHFSFPIHDFINNPSGYKISVDVISEAMNSLYLWQRRPSGYSV